MFENVTKIDFKLQSSISRYTFHKPKIFFKIIGFAVFVLGLLYLKKQFTHGLISMGLGLVLLFYILLLYDRMINWIVKLDFNKSLYSDGDLFNKYLFEKDYFICQLYKGGNLIKVISCKYENIHKVVDYENYILIFVNSLQCYAVAKQGMINCEPKLLLELLNSKA